MAEVLAEKVIYKEDMVPSWFIFSKEFYTIEVFPVPVIPVKNMGDNNDIDLSNSHP